MQLLFSQLWVADDVISRTTAEKKMQEEAMKKTKKELVVSGQKVTKLEEELRKAEAKIASLGHEVANFINSKKLLR